MLPETHVSNTWNLFRSVTSLVQDVWTGWKRAVAGCQRRQTRQCVGCWLVERQVRSAGLADISCSLLFKGTAYFFYKNNLLVFVKMRMTGIMRSFSVQQGSVSDYYLLNTLYFWKPCVLKGDAPPPSLAAFSPTDPSLVVYTGYGVEKELSFYSLFRKQVPPLPSTATVWLF